MANSHLGIQPNELESEERFQDSILWAKPGVKRHDYHFKDFSCLFIDAFLIFIYLFVLIEIMGHH